MSSRRRNAADGNEARLRRYRRWDYLTFAALIFTATVTPVEVGFLRGGEIDLLFWINACVDTIFITDILVQFVLAYARTARKTDGAPTRATKSAAPPDLSGTQVPVDGARRHSGQVHEEDCRALSERMVFHRPHVVRAV